MKGAKNKIMVVIRKAELEEVNKILDIKEVIFGEEKTGTYEECFKVIEDHGHWFRTAKLDGIIVGFITGIPVKDEVDTVAITCVGVTPEMQHEGIGELLMKSFIFIAQQKGIQKLVLMCDDDYANFFEKYGFVKNEKDESHVYDFQYNMELNTTVPRCSCTCGN